MEPREGDRESAGDATSVDYLCNKVDAADFYFIGKNKTKWAEV